jgi:hypothetical protein
MSYRPKREVQTKFWSKGFKIRGYMGYLGIDGRIFKCEIADWSELTHDKIR